MSEQLIEVKDLEVRYGAIAAVRGANLEVQRGEIVAVVGPNGAGKTTLLRAVAGFERAARGRVEFEGNDLSHVSPEGRVGLGMSMVPQGRRVFAESSVEMNLWAGAFLRKDRKEAQSDIENYFNFFPALRARRNIPAGMLSGGEQQMLALARAAMSRPKVLLLDEPSMGLAPIMVAQIFASLAEMSQSGVTMLLVEQNVARALEIADRVYVLVAGEMVGTDRPAAEVSLEDLAQTFLGLSAEEGGK
jgi:branched-chain amino acid transport system ATP-binding protein